MVLLRVPLSRKGFHISMRQILEQAYLALLLEARLNAQCPSHIVISLLLFSFLRNTEKSSIMLVCILSAPSCITKPFYPSQLESGPGIRWLFSLPVILACPCFPTLLAQLCSVFAGSSVLLFSNTVFISTAGTCCLQFLWFILFMEILLYSAIPVVLTTLHVHTF